MAHRKRWTNREINKSLECLSASYEWSPEQSAALEARVRREIIARYGRFDVPLNAAVGSRQSVVGSEESAEGRVGLSAFLRTMRVLNGVGRPALAFASFAVFVVGAIFVMRKLDIELSRQPVTGAPQNPAPSVVLSAAPIAPGSGAAISVFAISNSSEVGIQKSEEAGKSLPVTVRRIRRSSVQPITPAEGVFTQQWGKSVFSEEVMLRNERAGKSVFKS